MLNKRILTCFLVSMLSVTLLYGCGAGISEHTDQAGNTASSAIPAASSMEGEEAAKIEEEKTNEVTKPDGTFEIQMHTDGSVKLNYYSKKQISTIEYVIYSEMGGHDDTVQYSASYDGAAWTVDLSDDTHRRSGNYHVEVYLNGSMIGDTSFNFPLKLNETSIVLQKNSLENGDVKFFNGKILTTLNSSCILMDMECNELKRYDSFKANWFHVLEEDNLVVYSNSKKEVGLVQLDETGDIVSMSTVTKTENLSIDPTIAKCNGIYYVTATEIIGKINNSDASGKNGEYILHLYKSEDLINWTPVTDIVDEFYNIEDVDMYVSDGRLIVIFEKEKLDKGDSSICLTISDDNGETWSEPLELIPDDADHEPATLERYGENFYLFYSSDAEVPGFSYAGGSAYYSVYDNDFNCLVKDVKIQTETKEGILFYDCVNIDGSYYMAFATDYFGKKNLVIEKVRK